VLRRAPLILLGVSLAACASSTGTPAAEPDVAATTVVVDAEVSDPGTSDPDTSEQTQTDVPSSSVAADDGADQSIDTVAPATEVPEALRFSAPLIGGGEIDMAALAGRPVLLWFWSPF